jgi:uncharacterized membrane-anchored protein
MRTALLLAASLLAVSSAAAAEDAWTRLRNATANELCWDTARGFAREKHPTVQLGGAALTEASLTRASPPNPVKEGRKAFPGIRTC